MTDAVAQPNVRISPLGHLLVVVRIALIALWLIACVPLHYLWRVLGLGRTWPRVFLAGVGAIARLEIHRRGRRVHGALLLSNHVSWMDIIALAHTANSAFVAHDGLAQFGLLKWLCEMNDTVFVARHRRADVSNQADEIRDALGGKGTLTLFPEGTTSDGTGLLPFKSALLGALEPLPDGAQVQPVLLQYAETPDVAWVGEEPGLDNFRRILARVRPVKLDVHFLPPLTGDALANRKTMTAAARDAIAKAML